jgi:ATP-binding cassette subfamily G (WHITE) protein 2 (PDR)
MVNEFSGQQYACSAFVPSGGGPYAGVDGVNRVCSAVGSVAGSAVVDGNTYSKLLVGVRIMLTFAGTVNTAYAYYEANKWRNVGIVIAFIVFFMVTYLLASEFISAKKSKGEVLVFPRGHIPPAIKGDDVESGSTSKRPSEETGAEKADAIIEKQTAIFHWQDVVYDVCVPSAICTC